MSCRSLIASVKNKNARRTCAYDDSWRSRRVACRSAPPRRTSRSTSSSRSMPRTTWVWSCAGWCARTASRPPRRGAAARSSFSCCTGRGSPRPPSAPQARPRSGAAPRGHSTRNSGQTEISLASRLAGVAQAARARLERMRTIRAHRRSPRVLRRRGRGDATHADRQHHRARGRPRTEAGAFDARPSPIRVHLRAAAIDRGDHVSGNRARRRPCRARSTPCTASRARRLPRTPTIAHGVASPPPRRSPSPPANPRSAPFQAREPPQPRAGRGRRVPSPAGCAASAARRSGPTRQCPLNPRAPQVLVLDADAWPERNVLSLYDAEAPVAASVVALARWHAKCRSFTEGWNLADPLVRATLGRDRRAVDQRRFRASVLLVPDLERSRAASPVRAPRRRLDGSR